MFAKRSTRSWHCFRKIHRYSLFTFYNRTTKQCSETTKQYPPVRVRRKYFQHSIVDAAEEWHATNQNTSPRYLESYVINLRWGIHLPSTTSFPPPPAFLTLISILPYCSRLNLLRSAFFATVIYCFSLFKLIISLPDNIIRLCPIV